MNIPKFRAWDKVNKKMLEVNVIDFNFEKIRIINDNGHCISVDFKNIELMQSTGLKDKNGVEIYEGDIIDVGTTTPFIHRVEVDRQNAAFILIPIDSRWSKSYMYSFEDKSRYEVIGNIYENPELLKEVGQYWNSTKRDV